MREKPRPDRLGIEQEELASLTMHTSNLFDEDEDFAGQKVDEGTGERIDNSTARIEDLDRLDVLDGDVLQKPSDYDKAIEEDEAAKWLAEHDPKLKKKGRAT